MKRVLFILIILATSVAGASAQSYFAASYDMGLQVGSSSDYIGNFSARGFTLESRRFINDNVSMGFSGSWHIFYESTGLQTFEDGNVAVTAVQYRYVNAIPLLANAHYYLGEDGDVRFYVGAGLGTSRIIQRTEMGLYAFEDRAWTFAFAPEAGVLIPINFNNSFNLSVKYHHALKAKDLEYDISYLSFKVGFAFM